MALKFMVDALDSIEETVRPLYVQKDGKFQLDVEGVVPSSKLAEFRDNNIDLKKALEAFQGIDPVKAKEALSFQEQAKDKHLFDNGKIEELITSRTKKMQEEYETQVRNLSDLNVTQTRQLEGLLIDSAVRAAANKSAVLPSAVDDVLLRAKTVFRIEKGVATPFDQKGQVVYGKDGITPMTIDEWMGGLAKQATHLFAGSQGGGAPRDGSGRPIADASKLSPTQKIAAGLGG